MLTKGHIMKQSYKLKVADWANFDMTKITEAPLLFLPEFSRSDQIFNATRQLSHIEEAPENPD